MGDLGRAIDCPLFGRGLNCLSLELTDLGDLHCARSGNQYPSCNDRETCILKSRSGH